MLCRERRHVNLWNSPSLKWGNRKKKHVRQLYEALTHFELDPELWDSYPNTFSGGQKLRLNIACAIVKKPRLLLLDEPTASLDDASKLKVREMIERLKSGWNNTHWNLS